MSRLNAVRHGLFTEEAVPRVDGWDQQDLDDLRAKLRDQYQPAGVAEDMCIDEMVSSILLNHRVKLQEATLIRQAAALDTVPVDEHRMLAPAREDLRVFRDAQRLIQVHKAVSPAICQKVLQLIPEFYGPERAAQLGADGTNESVPVSPEFVLALNDAITTTERLIEGLLLKDEERIRDYYRSKSLLPESEMKQIIRAENRALKRFERAFRNLEHLQGLRRGGKLNHRH